jgi:mycofactocin precursor
MEQDTNERADETRSETTEVSAATVDVVDEQLIEEISIDGMCGVY